MSKPDAALFVSVGEHNGGDYDMSSKQNAAGQEVKLNGGAPAMEVPSSTLGGSALAAPATPTPILEQMADRRNKMNYRTKSWLTQKALDLVVWLNKDSNYISHTKREVPNWFKDEGPNRWMANGTVELLAVLSHQGHSGGSIGFAIKFFSTMARFEPWGPLTGIDSEWNEVDDSTWQNNRCSRVFKDSSGCAYDIEGRVFREPNGSCYTNKDSRVFITFPYTPQTEYVDIK